jgi:hypothetical protein
MPEMEPGRALFILILVGITIAIAIVLNGGGSPAGPGNANGTLTGNVSIGPLCPVEPCTIPHDQIVAAYAARPITISTAGGTPVTSVTADPVTGYTVALRPGNYVVDVTHQGIGGSRELPKTVTIRSGEVAWLNISIDTGIR